MSTELDSLRVAGALVRLARVLDRRLRLHGRDDGLGLAELGVLAEIERGTDLPSAIARVTYLDPARVTRVVDRLVVLGLVTRHTSSGDRRQSPLALVAPGRERLAHGRDEVREMMSALLAGLSADERDGLTRALGAIQRVLVVEAERGAG